MTRFSITTYILATYALTWSIWLLIPSLAGNDWVLIKVLVGVGIVPGLIAVLFERLQQGWNVNDFNRHWWMRFGLVSATVTGLVIWTLLDADGRPTFSSDAPTPPGLSRLGIVVAVLSGVLSGFVFATARSSKSGHLNSIAKFSVGPVWILIAILISALLYGVGVIVTRLSSGELLELPLANTGIGIWLPYLLRAFLVSWLLVTVGEETGWRGYLLPQLQMRFSPLIATIILGLVWGFWHAPLHYIGMYDHPRPPWIEISVFTVFTILFAFQFTWMFNRTGGVLLLALLLHAAHNTTTKILPGTAWILPLMALVAIVLICHERMWRKIEPNLLERKP